MKALVLGGGLIGVTSAYELLRDGWEVTLVERLDAPAMFTSHANAGLVAPGHAYAWSSPAAPGILMRSLWRNDQAFRFRPSLDPALWRWTWKFLRNCTTEKAICQHGAQDRPVPLFTVAPADRGVGNRRRLCGLCRRPALLLSQSAVL